MIFEMTPLGPDEMKFLRWNDKIFILIAEPIMAL